MSLTKLRERFGAIVGDVPEAQMPTTMRLGATLLRLRPRTVAQLRSIVAFCQENKIPVHPISGGANWGYGARVPWSNADCVLLDLGRLNKVIALDEKWGVVRLQAGVTFQQACGYLAEHDSAFMLNPTGGPPQGSVVANALERGHGLGAFDDRFTTLRRLRVVLPTGEEVETDFRQGGAAGAHRWGAGPNLRGLFSQSSFGIVVEADVLLAPRPKYWEVFSVWFFEPEHTESLVERIRERRFAHHQFKIQSAHREWSDQNGSEWPAKTTRVGYPLVARFYYWADDAAELAVARNRVEHLTRGAAGRRVVSKWNRISRSAENGLPKDVETTYQRDMRWDMPSDLGVNLTYRVRERGPSERPHDMDRDGIGLLWATPVVPMVGTEVVSLIREVERLAVKFGVEPEISMVSLNEWRYFDGVLGFLFDARVPGKLEAAQRALAEFQRVCAKRGYPMYRTGIQNVPERTHDAGRLAFLRRIKRAVDPAEILSPWRTRSS